MMFKIIPFLMALVVPPGEPSPKEFEQAIRLPEIGHHELHILAPRLLELYLVTTQDAPGGWETAGGSLQMVAPETRPQAWDFLDRFAPAADAPSKESLRVEVDSQAVVIERVGFRRRTLYAAKGGGDLRIGQSIYVLLGAPVAEGAHVSVTDADGASSAWLGGYDFSSEALANRFNPMIHVNQVGYGPTWRDQAGQADGGVKKAYLSAFLGDLGWLVADQARGEWMVAPVSLENGPSLDAATPVGLALDTPFEIIDAETSAVVYQSTNPTPYAVRGDSRWPTYNGVLELDFSDFVTPGNYRLRVPGFGASMPFHIGEELPAQLARTFALGLYHKRSGADHVLPYTRFVDPAGHLAPATMPFDDEQYFFNYRSFREQSNSIFTTFDKFETHPAAQIRSSDTLLFPYAGDVVAWWPMDGKEVVDESKVVAGFNAFAYDDTVTITDPFGGHPAGNAFGLRPARSAYPGQSANADRIAISPQQSWQNDAGQSYGELDGFRGVGFINTYQIYDPVEGEVDPPALETRATGVLETAPFVVSEPWLAFLIGGSAQPYDLQAGGQQLGVTAVNLLLNGVPVRTATGQDRNLLTWEFWDMQDLQGQSVRLQIIDSSTTGYLLVDEFQQSNRSALRDISSYRLPATLVGTPTFTSRQSDAALGNSLNFDGVDDAVQAHQLEPLDGASAFTLSVWVKLKSRDRDQVILSKGSDFVLRFDAATKTLAWQVGPVTVSSPRKIDNDAFHFVAATFRAGAEDGLRLWVDEPALLGTASTASLSVFPYSTEPLLLGGTGAEALHGGLDDLRIRASVVSDAELQDAEKGLGPWIDVSLGHFDAGDYGKYMINSALALHALIFAADQFLELPGSGGGPAPIDNLGIPESGDGIPDILQEAKWEADYIAKMQDSDGGFFFLVHPRERTFEDNVLPSEGDPQVVWPKTLAATGAAVGALVQTASAPSFKRYYPEAAAQYLAAGERGWQFIQRAIEKHGLAGAYQRLTHYGQLAEARDEVAWAAAAFFAATGDATYEARMKEWMPWNAETLHGLAYGWREFRRFTWQKLTDPAGAAMQTYLFANRGARSGKSISFDASLVGPKAYHEHVRDEVLGGADDMVAWANDSPFRASVPSESKRFGSVSYFFGISDGFDLLTAYLIDPKPEYFEGMINNVNQVLGANPANRSFISGLGWSQHFEYVSQFGINDERRFPLTGVNLGSVNTGLPWLPEYQGLLGWNVYPPDASETTFATPYGVYDRQTDVWNVSNEFVIPIQARAFATSAYLYRLTSKYTEPWTPAPAIDIVGAPERTEVGGSYDLSLRAPSTDLNQGRIIWEAPDQDFGLVKDYTIHTDIARLGWVEAEVFWPDGKRSYARSVFPVTEQIAQTVEQYQPTPSENGAGVYGKILGNGNVRLYYPLDSHFDDVAKRVKVLPGAPENPYQLTTEGAPVFDRGNFEWPSYAETRPDFRPLKISSSEDLLETTERTLFSSELFPPHTQWISMEAIIFIDEFNMNGSAAYMPALDIEGLAQPVRLWLYKDPWNGPITAVYGQTQLKNLDDVIPKKTWLHLRAVMDREKTTTYVNGEAVGDVPTEAFDTWIERGRRIKVLLGGFQGYVSDLIIKAGTGEQESLDRPVPPPLTGFQEWRDWQFEGDTGIDTVPDADPDGDGRANVIEYALGSSPHEAQREGVALTYVHTIEDEFALVYTRPVDREDVDYQLAQSTDLQTWSRFEPPLEASQVLSDFTGMARYEFNDPRIQPTSEARFLRLEVTVN